MKSILLKIENNIGFITLNRPDVFNSFNREMALLLQEILDNCANDANVRAIVITGSGKAFCAGQDLKEVTTPELNPGFRKILEEHYNPIIKKIRTIEKPIIAAVNGVAAGAGAVDRGDAVVEHAAPGVPGDKQRRAAIGVHRLLADVIYAAHRDRVPRVDKLAQVGVVEHLVGVA